MGNKKKKSVIHDFEMAWLIMGINSTNNFKYMVVDKHNNLSNREHNINQKAGFYRDENIFKPRRPGRFRT